MFVENTMNAYKTQKYLDLNSQHPVLDVVAQWWFYLSWQLAPSRKSKPPSH